MGRGDSPVPRRWRHATRKAPRADLAGSNNTTIDASSPFRPAGNPLPTADPYGRTVHFGVSEHAMARP